MIVSKKIYQIVLFDNATNVAISETKAYKYYKCFKKRFIDYFNNERKNNSYVLEKWVEFSNGKYNTCFYLYPISDYAKML